MTDHRLTRIQIAVLRRLEAEGEPEAGTEVADTLPTIGRSSIYAALEALMRRGYVTRTWDHSGTRPCRLNAVTEAGSAALRAELTTLMKEMPRA